MNKRKKLEMNSTSKSVLLKASFIKRLLKEIRIRWRILIQVEYLYLVNCKSCKWETLMTEKSRKRTREEIRSSMKRNLGTNNWKTKWERKEKTEEKKRSWTKSWSKEFKKKLVNNKPSNYREKSKKEIISWELRKKTNWTKEFNYKK